MVEFLQFVNSAIMFGLIEIVLSCFPLLYIIFIKMKNYNHDPIFNVYQRPNGFYWIKVISIFFVLYFRQIINELKNTFKDEEEVQKYFESLEKPQVLSNHDEAIDAVYFNAANKNGDHLVVGTARRKKGLIDGFLLVKIDKYGVLKSSKLPDSSLYQDDGENEEFGAEGLKIECVQPLKSWKITYNGIMRRNFSKNWFNVNLVAYYTSDLPIFNFDTHLDPFTMAKCLALEKWSREYFGLLKLHHQTHYEQHGSLKGHVEINNKIIRINMDSMRDHTFGNHREWKNLHKYNMHIFSTENGDRFTIGNVCFPLTISNFKMGYVYSAAERKYYSITYNDFELYQHGESGTPPRDYAFTIKAGGKTYIIQVNVINSPHFYISKDWECKVIERLCTFNINGIKGWGASEWQKRNMSGRSISQ